MRIDFDPAKDTSNQRKHDGLSLQMASALEWETLQCKPDTRKDYGETRMIGFALCGERLFCVVFVDRGAVRRIISLRKANNREKVRYAKIFDAS